MTSSSHKPPRRAESFNHCSIVLGDPKEFADHLCGFSGVWEPGRWKAPNIWRIEASIHFRMPRWGVVGQDVVVDGWRESPYVEWIEHWVYAKDRSMAIACLVRDLKLDSRAEFISYATVYRVLAPPTRQEVMEIETINTRLIRERMEEQQQQATDGRRTLAERQLEFAIS